MSAYRLKRLFGMFPAIAGLMASLLLSRAGAQPLSPEEAQRRLDERKAAAEAAAAVRPSPESAEVWNLLARTSGSYMIPDAIPEPAAPLTLEQLARSQDAHVAAVARQRLKTLAEYEQFSQAKTPTMQSIIATYEGITALTRCIYLGEENAQDYIDFMTRPGKVSIADRLRGATRNSKNIHGALESEIKVRNDLAELLNRKPREADFTKHIETGFELKAPDKAGPPEEVEATLINRTGKSLKNCVVIVRIKPDIAALAKLRQKQDAAMVGAGIVVTLTEGKAAAQQAARELNETRIAAAMLEQGEVFYIPEWKQGRKMDLLLGPATAAPAWKSVEIAVWSDEGRMAPRELEAAKITDDVNKAVTAWHSAMDRKKRYEYAQKQAEIKRQQAIAAAKAAPPKTGPRRTFGGNWVVRRPSLDPLGI